MRRLSLILFLLMIPLLGQTSYYSSYGFGMLSPAVSPRFLALGQSGLAIPDSIGLNGSNPALWNGFVTTSLQGQLGMSSFNTSVGIPGSVVAQFLGFSFKFPLGKKMGFAMGMQPYSRMHGTSVHQDTVNFYGESVPYLSNVDVEGGISEYFFGAGYRWSERFSCGVKTRLFFGTYLTRMETDIDDGRTKSYYRKYAGVEGLQIELGAYWINSKRNFELAATYSRNLAFDYYHYYDYYFGDDTTSGSRSIPFPTAIQLGARKTLGGSLAISADLGYALVSPDLYEDFYVINTSGAQNPFYVGIGIERLPSPKLYSSYWQRLSWRGGVFYKSAAVYQSGGLHEMGVSCGIGIPFNRFSNRIDLAVVASLRDGFLTDTIGREQVLSFYVGITAGELWFRRLHRY